MRTYKYILKQCRAIAALSELMEYGFPGNVRELDNILQRAFVLSDGNTILPTDIQLPGRPVRGTTGADYGPNPNRANVAELNEKLGNAFKERRLSSISLEDIADFLMKLDRGGTFSAGDLAEEIKMRSRNKKGNKNHTAYAYIHILKAAGIIYHNGKNTNHAGYFLADYFYGAGSKPGLNPVPHPNL